MIPDLTPYLIGASIGAVLTLLWSIESRLSEIVDLLKRKD